VVAARGARGARSSRHQQNQGAEWPKVVAVAEVMANRHAQRARLSCQQPAPTAARTINVQGNSDLGGNRYVSEQRERVRHKGASRVQLAIDLKARYERGASIRTLAEVTGCSYGFVRDLLKEAGVTLRARGTAPALAR